MERSNDRPAVGVLIRDFEHDGDPNTPGQLTRPGTLLTGFRPPVSAGQGPFRLETSAAQLRNTREAQIRRVLQRLTAAGRPVRVGRYTLVKPGQDPADRLAETQPVALRQAWEAPVIAWDSTGMTDPISRPHLARLFTAIRQGDIHGIVAVSHVDISAFHEIYEETLTTIRAVGGFLSLARNETAL